MSPPAATTALLDSYGFGLDTFQMEAIAAIDAGRSVLVSAPTGSGKTVVAEYAIAAAADRGMRAFYTTPIKALSNQKFADLRRHYGPGQVGLLTGDNSIDGDAGAVVMTTEVLRNMIYTGRSLDDLGVVVLDEVHYLQNTFRGPVWEEVIIHLPEHVQLVCLSATVSNAADIGDWLATVRGHTDVVVEERRPVALTNRYLVGDRATGSMPMVDVLVNGSANPDGRRYDREAEPSARGSSHGRNQGGREHGHGRSGRGARRRWFTPRRPEVVDVLVGEDLLPAIYFIFSRNGCDEAAKACLDAGISLTTSHEQSRIAAIADEHLAVLAPADLEALGVARWRRALLAGIASHHAGHVPPFKEAVEACFVEGLVKVVFATETLAMGINMPARAVVIERMTKFNGERREFLTPSEYTQLTGRAGRRGIDESGTAIVLWSPFVAFGEIAGLAASRSFVLRSAFRPTYNMAVNLIRRHGRDEAHHLLNQSLAQYQSNGAVVRAERQRTKKMQALRKAEGGKRSKGAKRQIRRLHRDIADIDDFVGSALDTLANAFDNILDLLGEWGFVDGWSLTERGHLLAGVYNESDLATAEALALGLFDDLDAPELAAVAAALVYEHRSATPPPRARYPSHRVADRVDELGSIITRLRAAEDRRDIPLTRMTDAGFCHLAHEWCAGQDLGELLEASELDLSGGDFVRTVRQLADLVRQIGQVAPLAATRATARRAVTALERGVVAGSASRDDIDVVADQP